MSDVSDRYGINMKLGKYMLILFIGVLAVLLLTVYTVLENQKLRKEIEKSQTSEYSEELEKEMRSIYLILAQQSANMRTIMNVGVTNSHWSEHNGRVAQHECPECLAIYKQIRDQREELAKKVGYEGANFPILERLGAKTVLDEEGVKENADKQGRGN